MKTCEIHIRDPFVLAENGKYYLYGTRAGNWGTKTSGFDVYVSIDLENWSEPKPCFDSAAYGLNDGCNWAPEVHKYKGEYYMFATFSEKSNCNKKTYILKSSSPEGPFAPHSKGAVTPTEWECLDGTFYLSEDNKPFVVFSHEHTQIIDGTICYAPLSDDLTERIGEPQVLFSASSSGCSDPYGNEKHYVTDGPFLFRSKSNQLFMIWSTFIKNQYSECIVKFAGGKLGGKLTHLTPLINNDGGHGMIFNAGEKIYLTLHRPNTPGKERPVFIEINDQGDSFTVG
ncbi:MAG: family 43 glycosylhydrolase [Clostridia bacterium]|nr:family 43 glycosylhydrolase [Clostridia bacterium]